MLLLSLGSNLGDRLGYLSRAIKLLSSFVSDISISPVYESEALLPDNSPESWDIPFLNIALSGKTTLSPREVLIKVKEIEYIMGRKEDHELWSPREIDIDILAYDDKIVNEKDLVIPHMQLLDRAFFLFPMADLVPDWKYPVAGENYGKDIASICSGFRDDLNTRLTSFYIDI